MSFHEFPNCLHSWKHIEHHWTANNMFIEWCAEILCNIWSMCSWPPPNALPISFYNRNLLCATPPPNPTVLSKSYSKLIWVHPRSKAAALILHIVHHHDPFSCNHMTLEALEPKALRWEVTRTGYELTWNEIHRISMILIDCMLMYVEQIERIWETSNGLILNWS